MLNIHQGEIADGVPVLDELLEYWRSNNNNFEVTILHFIRKSIFHFIKQAIKQIGAILYSQIYKCSKDRIWLNKDISEKCFRVGFKYNFLYFYNFIIFITQFPRFLDITRTKLVNEGETAVLSCQVDAFPYNSETVSWFRDGYDIGKIICVTHDEKI